MKIPEGFALVVLRPTEDMLYEITGNDDWNIASKIYRRVLELSPPPPEQDRPAAYQSNINPQDIISAEQREILITKWDIFNIPLYAAPQSDNEENARLKAEIEFINQQWTITREQRNDWMAKHAVLDDENLKLRKDSERLDFLIQPGISLRANDDPEPDYDDLFAVFRMTGYPNDREWIELGHGGSVREAIDNAMKGEK